MKYVIIERNSNRYVETLTFSESGVSIEFTSDEERAARVSFKEVAENLAKCVPSGVVRVGFKKAKK